MPPEERGSMGRFYDMFYKRGEEPELSDVVRVNLPPGFAPTPAGYGALMSIDYAACEQTKARSMASLPFSVVNHRRSGSDQPSTREAPQRHGQRGDDRPGAHGVDGAAP